MPSKSPKKKPDTRYRAGIPEQYVPKLTKLADAGCRSLNDEVILAVKNHTSKTK